jgi:hypothetical protein
VYTPQKEGKEEDERFFKKICHVFGVFFYVISRNQSKEISFLVESSCCFATERRCAAQ